MRVQCLKHSQEEGTFQESVTRVCVCVCVCVCVSVSVCLCEFHVLTWEKEGEEEKVGELPDWKGSQERRMMGLMGEALSRDSTYSEEDLKSSVWKENQEDLEDINQ